MTAPVVIRGVRRLEARLASSRQMAVQYFKTYIDRAVDGNDLITLYDVIRVVESQRDLAEPLRLFLRLWEWMGSTRSGVWQYYENSRENSRIAAFENIAAMMDHCGLKEIAARYRAGIECWEEPRYCDDLDRWIETNESMLEETAMQLIRPYRTQPYPTRARKRGREWRIQFV